MSPSPATTTPPPCEQSSDSRAPEARKARVPKRSRASHLDPTIQAPIPAPALSNGTLSKAAVKQISPFRCNIPLLELTEDKMFTSFPEMPKEDQEQHLYHLVVFAERQGPFVGPYIMWQQCRDIDPGFVEDFQANNVRKVVSLPNCEYLVRAMATFHNVQNRAKEANNSPLLLAAVKREADYRLMLATTRSFSNQVSNIEDFESQFWYLLSFMRASQSDAAASLRPPPAENAANGTLASPAGGQKASTLTSTDAHQTKDLQEAREIVRSCRRDLAKNSLVLHPSEVKGLDDIRGTTMQEIECFKEYLHWAEESEFRMDNVLLYGPQGTGKTGMVYSLAKWSGFP